MEVCRVRDLTRTAEKLFASESLKAFLDRFHRTCMPEKGKVHVEGNRAAGICVAGAMSAIAAEWKFG